MTPISHVNDDNYCLPVSQGSEAVVVAVVVVVLSSVAIMTIVVGSRVVLVAVINGGCNRQRHSSRYKHMPPIHLRILAIKKQQHLSSSISQLCCYANFRAYFFLTPFSNHSNYHVSISTSSPFLHPTMHANTVLFKMLSELSGKPIYAPLHLLQVSTVLLFQKSQY